MQTTLKNRTIFCADNIDVLRGINTETVDLIYLDPPFNKNKVFTSPLGSQAEGASFRDIFREEDVKEEWIHELREENEPLAAYLDSTERIGYRYNKYYLVYMARRLIEMYRILKTTGSLYLHCDPTMSHYLKLLMDCIFGEKNFQNEIIWEYKTGGVSSKRFAKKHDVILFYSRDYRALRFYIQKEKSYTKSDSRKPGIVNYGKGTARFLEDNKGVYTWVHMRDVWAISYIGSTDEERVGYPTQKPLALLERIIKASTHEGDLVLDPFCGCATTCVAAERLKRKWIGIDVSVLAYKFVQSRLKKEVVRTDEIFNKRVFFREGKDAYVQRTDLKKNKLSVRETKSLLYGTQEGNCKGCGHHFPYPNLEIDHILAKSKGGGDNYENLQLLCGACNRRKGDKGMDALRAKLGK